jgi:hypothetical protein
VEPQSVADPDAASDHGSFFASSSLAT